MNKKEFLEKLTQKIKILNKDEIADIIEEYAGYIDNKIAEGKSEEEAVADFGNVNDLAKEILSAYKLSEDYIPPDEFSGSKFFADTADILNKSVEFMSRFFKDISNHTNANYIVGILVTLFIALVLVAIVKIPFLVIEHFGRMFIHFVFPSFLSDLLSFIWILLVNIIYLIVVIFIFVSLLKGGFGENIDFIRNSIKKAAKRKNEYWGKHGNYRRSYHDEHYPFDSAETPASEAHAQEEPGPEASDDYRASQINRDDNASQKTAAVNPFAVLLKVIINIFAAILLLPLLPSVIGLCIAAGACVYLLMQGISVYGLTLFVLGFLILFTSFISLIIRIIYRHGKKLRSQIAKILIASVMIGFGGVFSFFEFMNYDYIDTIPQTREFTARKSYRYDIVADKIVINANGAVLKHVIDNTLEDRIMLDIRYNDLYSEIDVNESGNGGGVQIIAVDHSVIMTCNGLFSPKGMIKNIIDDLKDKKIYNFRKLFLPEITVYTNDKFIGNVSDSYGDSYGKHHNMILTVDSL